MLLSVDVAKKPILCSSVFFTYVPPLRPLALEPSQLVSHLARPTLSTTISRPSWPHTLEPQNHKTTTRMTAVYNLALAPSAMAKTRLRRSRPSPAFTLMIIGSVSKHVFSSVIHLPKKFSCVSDQVSSPQERVLFPSEVHSQGQSSCTASTWDFNAEKEFERSGNTTPVATEPTTTWEAGPILPMEQLEAALSRTSLALDESAATMPDTPKTSKPSRRLSISVVSSQSNSHTVFP